MLNQYELTERAVSERAKRHRENSRSELARAALRMVVAGLLTGAIVMFGWIVGSVLFGAGCSPSTALPAPCDAVTLSVGAARCRELVRARCSRSDAGVVDAACPELQRCDKWVDDWLACHGDAGSVVSGGTAGAK